MSTSEARKAIIEKESAAETFASAAMAPDAADEAPAAIEPNLPDVDDVPVDEPQAGDPSWFSRTYEDASPGEMAKRYQENHGESARQAGFATPSPEAYDAYKRRLEERFRIAQMMVDPAFDAPPIASRTRQKSTAPKRPMRAPFAPRGYQTGEPTPARRGMVSAIVLTMLACGLGGAGGYVAANPGAMASMLSNPTITLSHFYASLFVAKSDVTRTALNKAAPAVRFDVSDVSGPVNGPIALGISTFPVSSESPIAIRISGLPPEAYLTKGVAVAQGEWLLKSTELAKAELVVPRSTTSLLGLEVAALDEKTGKEAGPPKQMNVALDLAAVPLPGAVPPPESIAAIPVDVVVEPVSALPDQGFNHPAETKPIPVPLQTISSEAMAILAKGQTLLKGGDLIAARQYFLKAHALKLPEAAYYVGQTYDPATYEALHIIGLEPDVQLASEWYGKAAAQGVAAANDALTKLSAK